ncbi:hypothetical protein EDC19_2353 [Natranaerovirga hydrolytica]|uniref:Uncharacterized protein n=1 Tax=Natranaerovirga hydrolytica TaxID=680378 RepID=A0A4R1MHH2_9FIRM|nr:hypothetical protein [Natranaerovirga hydrolytica]TCK90584.1 hypothetical protein EDC19_2353 [Natranaerovirga hydrolytica]
MLSTLLEIREIFILYYKRFEKQIVIFLKFLTILITLSRINSAMGYAAVLNRGLVTLALSLVLSVLPGSWVVFVLGLIIITHLAFVSIEAALIVGVLLFVLYFMFINLFPKMGYYIIATPLLFSLNLPYAVPIFAGIFSNPMTIIPVSIGVIIYYFSGVLSNIIRIQPDEIADMPIVIMQMYQEIIDALFSNQALIYTVIVFALIIILTYIMTRLSIDYIWYISIITAGIVNFILFLIGNLVFDVSVGILGLFIQTVFSIIIVMIMQFFRCVLDYNRTESVQYEDEDYYYYVKAIPKIKISKSKRSIQKIRE